MKCFAGSLCTDGKWKSFINSSWTTTRAFSRANNEQTGLLIYVYALGRLSLNAPRTRFSCSSSRSGSTNISTSSSPATPSRYRERLVRQPYIYMLLASMWHAIAFKGKKGVLRAMVCSSSEKKIKLCSPQHCLICRCPRCDSMRFRSVIIYVRALIELYSFIVDIYMHLYFLTHQCV